jgi:hypothetical protein
MLSFIRDYLGAPAGVDVDELKAQNDSFKKQLEQKDAEIAELKKQVGGPCSTTLLSRTPSIVTFLFFNPRLLLNFSCSSSFYPQLEATKSG